VSYNELGAAERVRGLFPAGAQTRRYLHPGRAQRPLAAVVTWCELVEQWSAALAHGFIDNLI